MNKLLAGALIAAVAAPVGCSSFDREAQEANPAPCPNVIVLSDAARMVEFDGEEQLDDVAYTAEITDVTTRCRYYGDEPIDAEVDLRMAFGKGPKGANGEKYFKYFVAVTRKDIEVIAKKEFIVAANFNDDRIVVVKKEDIDKITIPRASEETSGLNFEIVIGLSLTPEQAIYNRSGKSLKFPQLQ
ncbi:MAG: hypothetical protein AAF936_02770 [Pseudomonadota bacterium]